MTRRRAVGLRVAGLLHLVFCGVVAAAELPQLERGAARGASLLLVTLDTTRADHLGAYGARGALTPNLDALAASGWLFENAFTPVPVTLPAHTSLMTGLYPPRHGVRHNVEYRLAPGGLATLAERLRGAGYATAAFVSAFVLDARFGLDRGFEVYDAAVVPPHGSVFPAGVLERPAPQTVAAALEWLARQPAGRPVFLWVHLYEPHAPYEPPEPWRTRFAARPYDGEIAAADHAFGSLLAGIAGRDPLVVVAGDHGEGLGDHGESTHSILLYDGLVRVPLLMRLPRALHPAAARVDRLVSLVDVLPSLLHALGVTDAAARDGLDWFSPPPAAPRTVYLETLVPWLDYGWSPLTAVRSARAKLIHSPHGELYDLVADAAESRNLTGDSAHRREAGELARALATHERAPASAPEAPLADEETRSALASLGYLGGAGPAPGESLADPRDKIGVANALLEAHAEMQAGRLEPALAGLLALQRESPRDRSVLQSLGKVYLRLGRVRDAERVLLGFTAIRPKADVSLLLAQIALLDGRLAEAAARLDEAAALEPRHGGVEIARGDLAVRQGRLDEARAHYRRAAEIDPYRAAGTAAARLSALPQRP